MLGVSLHPLHSIHPCLLDYPLPVWLCDLLWKIISWFLAHFCIFVATVKPVDLLSIQCTATHSCSYLHIVCALMQYLPPFCLVPRWLVNPFLWHVFAINDPILIRGKRWLMEKVRACQEKAWGRKLGHIFVPWAFRHWGTTWPDQAKEWLSRGETELT